MHRRPTAETFDDEPLFLLFLLFLLFQLPFSPQEVLSVDSLRQVEIQLREFKCDRTDNDQFLTDSNTDFESVPSTGFSANGRLSFYVTSN